MEHTELAKRHLLSNKMNVELDVLRALVMNRVRGHVHRRDVVAVGHGHLVDGAVELTEELPQLDALGRRVRHGAILRIRAGARDRRLPLR